MLAPEARSVGTGNVGRLGDRRAVAVRQNPERRAAATVLSMHLERPRNMTRWPVGRMNERPSAKQLGHGFPL